MHKVNSHRAPARPLLQADISVLWFSWSRSRREPEKGMGGDGGLSCRREQLQRPRHPLRFGKPCFHNPSVLRTQESHPKCGQIRMELNHIWAKDQRSGGIWYRDAGRSGSGVKFQAELFCKFCLSWTHDTGLLDTGCWEEKGDRQWAEGSISIPIVVGDGGVTCHWAWLSSSSSMGPPHCPLLCATPSN